MWWFLAMTAMGAECDIQQLQQDVEQASPIAVGRYYVQLAECDPEAARKLAPKAMLRVLASDDGNRAALHALLSGAPHAVDTWLENLEPGERTGAIDFLGEQCADHPPVAAFFVQSRDAKGETFWTDRWYRGLADCRTPSIQALLTEIMAEPSLRERNNRSRFFGILDVYARNLGAEAIPELERLVTELADRRERTLVVRAYADAAQVGTLGGSDLAVLPVAIASLERVAPHLPTDGIESLRDTLMALDAPEVAGAMVRYRWPDRLRNGRYTYVAYAIESVTCKNGKTQAIFHYGDIQEAPTRWPNGQADALHLPSHWGLDAAAQCKGTGETTLAVIEEPVMDDAHAESWLQQHLDAFRSNVAADKKSEVAHEPLDHGEATAP
jgi:hypothetical protein